MPRNPNWTRDELILALDCYMQHRNIGRTPSKRSDLVKALSAQLNRLAVLHDLPRGEKFRNATGVYLKLANFMAIDPDWPGAGMKRMGKNDRQVWKDFAGQPETLNAAAQSILEHLAFSEENPDSQPLILAAEEQAALFEPTIEGRILSTSHIRRERNPRLAEQLKATYFDAHGYLDCSVCQFDFEHRYGKHGHRYMEAHHLKPISELSPKGEKTALEDLALICANCHRMVHRKSPWLKLDELRAMLRPA